jgi:glycosyltransferase involved in cell wall biosynthesis
MPISHDEVSKNAKGGTELMKFGLAERLDPKVLDEVQIIASRVRELDETKVRVLWCHDLPGDPESDHLKDRGWDKFHKIVFVSNWQMQAYIQHYNIPWSKCIVLQNAIEPLDLIENKGTDKIKLVYTSTPHRGLDILYSVFDKLCEKHDNLELDVFSSFKLYGWPERDKQFRQVFDALEKHPKINYHGTQPNDVVRKAVSESHIMAYPSTWPETSCLCLIEAMSAGLACVHPNFAALPETAANWNFMYQWNEDKNEHAKMFYTVLDSVISDVKDPNIMGRLRAQKSYIDTFYSWDIRSSQWDALLRSLLDEPRGFPKQTFRYSTG